MECKLKKLASDFCNGYISALEFKNSVVELICIMHEGELETLAKALNIGIATVVLENLTGI